MILRHLGAFRRREDGNATIEFALIFPVFAFLLISSVETGLLAVRQAMLERAAGLTERDIRLDGSGSMTLSERKSAFCGDAIVFSNCEDTVFFAFEEVGGAAWDFSQLSTGCVDSTDTVTPVNTFTTGLTTNLSVVRICALFDPLFPTSGLGATLRRIDGEHYAQVVHTAFVSEAGS
ncbi:MAG: pilus assembly protein [Salibaculum sp.]|uniref:TadE/TadG family type IV pilus assembly protein n=1 Tax=Salibaculum sp. TaxID=2855480 RepID=UPI0028705825|nr:TadE/TadG family type IV pilus assembly protein [Salibaculum sp.]MDR9426915.1 pilus assembly protein [Salibaculum sp.]MDR9483462.1 pilus assembly protein [Salibaculum sp.]